MLQDSQEVVVPERETAAPFTWFLVLLNVLMFAGELWACARGTQGLWQFLAVASNIPTRIAMAFGANYASAALYEGRIDTLVTSCFVHVGILHFAFNMFILRYVGSALEQEVGSGRTSVLYVGSGIVGNMVSAIYWGFIVRDQHVSAGASGAICGLIGAALVVGYRSEGWRSQTTRAMGLLLVVLFLLALLGGLDNASHAGGAIAGGLIALLWRAGDEPPQLRKLSLTGSVAIILVAGLSVVYYDATRPFATMDVAERLEYAHRAVLLGNCNDGWAGVRAARYLAPRSQEVLHTVQAVRARCGQDPKAMKDSEAEGASR